MKNLKIAFALLVSVSLLFSACKKDDDPVNPGLTYKGSFSVNINGVSYSTLKSDITEVTEGVTFFADDKKGGQFQIAIPNVPAVGETVTLSFNSGDDVTTVMVANGPIEGITTLIAGAGTIYRQSDNKYVLENIVLYGGTAFAEEFPMSGNITVGTHGTK